LTQDEIFKAITGSVLKDLTDHVNLASQGWKKSGLPRAIQLLASLFRQVQNVSAEVLAAYGGQNPFSSWHALKHHLAAYVTSLGHSDDPAILWKATPSKLAATGRAVIVEYDTPNGSASLSQPPQAGPVASSIDPDNIKRDCFAGCFLIFEADQTLLQQTLSGKLTEQVITVAGTTTPLNCPRTLNCPRIVFMQAVVVEFFSKKQQGARRHKSNRETLDEVSAGFVSHVFPRQKQFSDNRKHVGISAKILDKLMSRTDIDSYDSLWEEVSKDPSKAQKPNHAVYILATKNLRPPSELQDAKNIVDAWLPADRMDPTSRELHKIQVEACVNHVNQQALATLVLAEYGIISEQYLDLIKNTRTSLRQLITELRHAVVGSDDWEIKKTRCCAFVASNRLPGNKRIFDFDELLPKPN
jgi:hypothetical protein